MALRFQIADCGLRILDLNYRGHRNVSLFRPHPSSFILLLFVLAACLSDGPAWARPDLTRRVPPRPIAIEMLDGEFHEGSLLGLEDSQWIRPVAIGQTERPPKAIQVNLSRGPAAIPTTELWRVFVQPVEQLVVRSDPTVTVLYLGWGANQQAEPTDWYQPEAQIAGWEPAALQSSYYGWRYIPQACWIWAKRASRPRDDDTVLFRHEFFIPTTATLVSAHLDISADNCIESFFVNGVPVRIPIQSLLGKISRWDVTYLLRPGRNLVAARVSNAPSSEQLNSAGLCYRIVCDLAPEVAEMPPIAPSVRVMLTNGDCLSGNFVHVSSQQWVILSNGQKVEVDPDWIDLALVNYRESFSTAHLPRSGIRSLFGKRPVVASTAQPPVAWSEDVERVADSFGLRARNGEWLEGRIEGLQANRIQIKPRYGETFGVALDRIAYLQPNRLDSETQFLFRPADFPAIVRVRLRNGDQVTGALESLTPATIVITPHFSKPIRFGLDDVLNIDFVMNTAVRYRERIARAWPAQVPRSVAVIGEADSALGASRDTTIQATRRALLNLGLEMQWLDPYQMIEPGNLSPDRYPVLINLDQNERLYYTMRSSGDGFGAIKRYVEQGGTFAHFARGVPFAHGSVPDRSRWKVTRPPTDLNAVLMMDIVTPDRRSPDARPFQLPPNQGQHMLFVLNRRSPLAEGLPAAVEIPMIADMRFRPITDDRVTTPSRFIPIYYLVDQAGINYGVAMAAIRYPQAGGGRPHYGFYVSHLLYQASVEGIPMLEYLIPKVLDVALGGTNVAVSNLANDINTRSAQVRVEPNETSSPPARKILPSP